MVGRIGSLRMQSRLIHDAIRRTKGDIHVMDFAQRKFTRREALGLGLLGSAALLLPLERRGRTALQTASRLTQTQIPAPFQVPFAVPPLAQPAGKTGDGRPFYNMSMQARKVQILPGFPATTIYGYNGIAPGPTIACRRGEPIVVRHINALPSVAQFNYPTWTSVHLHGSASLPQYDGYASDVTNPGEYKDYHYPNIQDARTLWYHDHGVHHTAQNAYMGLAAQYHLHDDVEDSLPIPKSYGRYDIPLIIQDKIFDTNGQFVFDDGGESSIYGDVILVNGRPWPVMKVERRKYRFRVLNASVSRSYRLALSTGQPFTFIGTDGGLMPAPQQSNDFRIGQAERYEIVIDFSKNKVGDKVILKNLGNPNNVDFPSTRQIMRFDVVSDATDTTDNEVPAQLNPNRAVMDLQPPSATGHDQEMQFIRKNGEWTVSGHTWEDVISSNYTWAIATNPLDSVRTWRLTNPSGGWFHPVHIHLVDFKVIDRNGKAPFPYELGPKDVVYTGEGESIRVAMRFSGPPAPELPPRTGRYMMHCHNLVHEDHDMMIQFNVGDSYPNGGDPNDPRLAAQAKPYDPTNPPPPPARVTA
jgi:spore coat protein A, manganese oxidase